jgi:hypothetical protein
VRPLKVKRMGDEVQGVQLFGDPKKQHEPTYFRVVLPFGDVDIVRCSGGEYWVHVRVNRPGGQTLPGQPTGVIEDARIDSLTPDAAFPCEALADGGLYHLAVRLGPDA